MILKIRDEYTANLLTNLQRDVLDLSAEVRDNRFDTLERFGTIEAKINDCNRQRNCSNKSAQTSSPGLNNMSNNRSTNYTSTNQSTNLSTDQSKTNELILKDIVFLKERYSALDVSMARINERMDYLEKTEKREIKRLESLIKNAMENWAIGLGLTAIVIWALK